MLTPFKLGYCHHTRHGDPKFANKTNEACMKVSINLEIPKSAASNVSFYNIRFKQKNLINVSFSSKSIHTTIKLSFVSMLIRKII